MFMNKFGMENDQCIEEKSLSRIVGFLEDMQFIRHYKMKMQNENGKEIPVPATPTRD